MDALLSFSSPLFSAQLVSHGLVTEAEVRCLQEVFEYNPLLFDLVLKLTARHPTTGAQLPPSVFGAHPLLPPRGKDLDEVETPPAPHAAAAAEGEAEGGAGGPPRHHPQGA